MPTNIVTKTHIKNLIMCLLTGKSAKSCFKIDNLGQLCQVDEVNNGISVSEYSKADHEQFQ